MSPRSDLEDDIDQAARRNARGGAAETAAGALLGGLLLGPFGALFGANLGANLGASNAVDRARQEEMARLGVTKEMLETAQECGLALERSIEGLEATRNSLETQQKFAKRLDESATALYEKAKEAMTNGNEHQARKHLLERETLQDKLKSALLSCAEDKKRLETMEQNVVALEERATEVESLLQRTVGAKALQDTSSKLSLAAEDPLVQKFKDLGID